MSRSISSFLRNIIYPGDFFSALQLFLIICVIFGTTPIGLFTTKDSTYLTYLETISRVFVTLYLFMDSVLFTETYLTSFFSAHVSRVIDLINKSSFMAGILTVFLVALIRRKKLRRVITLLNTIEDKLYELGVFFIQRNFMMILSLKLVLTIGLNLSFVVISACNWEMHISSWFSIFVRIASFAPNWILSLVVLMSCSLNHKIFLCFRANNKVLKNLSNQWENRKVKSISPKNRSLNCLESFSMYTIATKNPAEIIQESMEIHHLICEAASTANKYFTYQLLTIISIAFLIIVFDAYYVLETLLGKSKRESKFKTVEFLTFFSCQMILYLIAIISIVEGSNRAIKKSEKTGGIIHNLLNKAKNPDVKEKLQQFSMQLVHLKIKFTAAGLFNIDRTLYFTISGALTTYLIILLQFTSSTPDVRGPCIFVQNATNEAKYLDGY